MVTGSSQFLNIAGGYMNAVAAGNHIAKPVPSRPAHQPSFHAHLHSLMAQCRPSPYFSAGIYYI